MRTAIFLGGGASAAEGAPMQTELIREYFKLLQGSDTFFDSDMYKELTAYFREIFGINPSLGNYDTLIFPTFEEALGILDLAVKRREGLKNFDLENISRNSNRIGFMRQYLVLLVAAVLNNAEKNSSGLHKKLVKGLEEQGLLSNTVFITTNYDLLIDMALNSSPGRSLDYGFEFCDNGHRLEEGKKISLYKVHGSLNWLYCPTCNIISLTKNEPGVIRLLTDLNKSDCEECGSIMLPVIVPPTFFKEMSNVYLSAVWNKAELALRLADRIVFCGYSFPDSDIHIKYLLKRVQTNRKDTGALKFTVINYHQGKNPYTAEQEHNRYMRFLGSGVDYTNWSFADIADDPGVIFADRPLQ